MKRGGQNDLETPYLGQKVMDEFLLSLGTE
jgi:hypothetical protein